MRHIAAILFSVLLLASCDTISPKGGEPLAQRTYNHVQALPINVSVYKPVPFVGMRKPADFLPNPDRMVHDFLQHRFRPSGEEGMFVVTIRDIMVRHGIEESSSGIGKFVGVDKKDHYQVRVLLQVEAYGVPNMHKDVSMNVTATRTVRISEHSSLVKKEKAQMQAMDDLISDIDKSLQDILTNQLQILY